MDAQNIISLIFEWIFGAGATRRSHMCALPRLGGKTYGGISHVSPLQIRFPKRDYGHIPSPCVFLRLTIEDQHADDIVSTKELTHMLFLS